MIDSSRRRRRPCPTRRYRVVYRPEAVADLEEIYRFVRARGESRNLARGYVVCIRERCRRIGDAPLTGVARDDLAPGPRTAGFERRAVIAYRITDGAVEIANIFYGGRDYETLFRGHAESGR